MARALLVGGRAASLAAGQGPRIMVGARVGLAALGPPSSIANVAIQRQGLATATVVRSPLEEFFPADTENTNSGRAWIPRDLRIKSNVDLHKLWYILLKERNMLLTVKQEAVRQGVQMPGKERLRKVRKSMAAVKLVIGEREIAAKQAAEMDPELWERIRSDVSVTTGVRPKLMSGEAGGRVSRAGPPKLPEDNEQSAAQHAQLLGINRPGLRRGGPQRPMTKSERAKFRSNLSEARAEVLASELAATDDLIKSMTDDDLRKIVDDAEQELLDGWNEEDLAYKSLAALKEAHARDMDTIWVKPGSVSKREDKSNAQDDEF